MKLAARIVGASGIVVIECALAANADVAQGGPTAPTALADAGPAQDAGVDERVLATLSAELTEIGVARAEVALRHARLKALLEPLAATSTGKDDRDSAACGAAADALSRALAEAGIDVPQQGVADIVAAIGKGGQGAMALALFLCAAIADVVPDPGARADAGPPPPSRHTATIKRLAQAAAVHGKLEPAIVLPHLDAALAARRAVPVPRAELELPANVTGIRVASSVLAVINRSYATHLAKLAARHDAVKQELTRLRSRAAVPKGLTR